MSNELKKPIFELITPEEYTRVYIHLINDEKGRVMRVRAGKDNLDIEYQLPHNSKEAKEIMHSWEKAVLIAGKVLYEVDGFSPQFLSKNNILPLYQTVYKINDIKIAKQIPSLSHWEYRLERALKHYVSDNTLGTFKDFMEEL
jgi:hypothetical protein